MNEWDDKRVWQLEQRLEKLANRVSVLEDAAAELLKAREGAERYTRAGEDRAAMVQRMKATAVPKVPTLRKRLKDLLATMNNDLADARNYARDVKDPELVAAIEKLMDKVGQ